MIGCSFLFPSCCRRFCAYHLQDAEPVQGSDLLLKNIATCLIGSTDLVPMRFLLHVRLCLLVVVYSKLWLLLKASSQWFQTEFRKSHVLAGTSSQTTPAKQVWTNQHMCGDFFETVLASNSCSSLQFREHVQWLRHGNGRRHFEDVGCTCCWQRRWRAVLTSWQIDGPKQWDSGWVHAVPVLRRGAAVSHHDTSIQLHVEDIWFQISLMNVFMQCVYHAFLDLWVFAMHGWEYTARCMYHIFCFARSVLDMLSKQLTNMCEKYTEENPELSTRC